MTLPLFDVDPIEPPAAPDVPTSPPPPQRPAAPGLATRALRSHLGEGVTVRSHRDGWQTGPIKSRIWFGTHAADQAAAFVVKAAAWPSAAEVVTTTTPGMVEIAWRSR